MPPLTITAELRQWRKFGREILGVVYNDIKQNFFDGEEVTILLVKDLINTPNYYVAVCDGYNYRLDKSQEVQ